MLTTYFSYWMYQGEKYHDINVQALEKTYDVENQRARSCNVMLSEQDVEADDYAQIGVQNCKS